jgi:hypothetical protein
MTGQLVLHFEISEGKNPNTEIAAQALLDWVALAKATIAAIEPYDKVVFEIVGVEHGSTRFPQLMRFLERGIENVSSAWDDYPYIKKMVVGSVHVLVTGSASAIIAAAMVPDVQKVEFTDSERAIQADMMNKAAESAAVRSSRERFYRTIEADPAITGVGVSDDWNKRPDVIVLRSEFPAHSGLWTSEIAAAESERKATDIWDVVLTKASFTSTPQTWQFSRDGLKFGAKMHDALFLAAVKDGRVPITLQEGVIMRVKVEYTERLNGQIWEAVSGSRRIIQVISPIPTATATTLPFPKNPR